MTEETATEKPNGEWVAGRTIDCGATVRDSLSQIEGKVIARTEWLYGCVRITIQPPGSKEGKPFEPFVIDEPQAFLWVEPPIMIREAPPSMAQAAIRERAAAKHGDRPNAGRRADPQRV